MKNCIVAQSGGPTVAINASLSGAIEKAYTSGSYDHIYGSLHGILGILNNDIICFDDKLEDETFYRHLLRRLPCTLVPAVINCQRWQTISNSTKRSLLF